ncbi:MAG: discoidin domain-containing protein [Deltaproteobacteria bacterium]|nr:discoidin domain-containing protein [Deltaproteobacteria bacterium]
MAVTGFGVRTFTIKYVRRILFTTTIVFIFTLLSSCGGGKVIKKRNLLDVVQDATASSQFSEGYRAMFAFDGKIDTRWMATETTWKGWLEARYAEPRSFSKASFTCAVQEKEGVPKDFFIEYFDPVTNDWAVALEVKDNQKEKWSGSFEAHSSDRWRIRVTSVINDQGDLTISELTFYN